MIVRSITLQPQTEQSRSIQSKILLLAIAVTVANVSLAQTPAAAPVKATTNAAPAASPASANAITALCNDGTTFSGDSKKGACAGHKGVKTWTSDEMKSEKASDSAKNATPVANAAPGGGAVKVWLNTKSNVYHCPADRYYGKTKKGEYMSEADAKAKGAHADHGKSCT